MNAVRLGLFQESTDRFAFAVHADSAPVRLYREFGARDLRAAIVSRPTGETSVELTTLPDEVAQARNLVSETMARDPASAVTGGVMALDTASDSWQLTVLLDSAPGYHVALAFSLYPLRMTSGKGRLVHVAYEEAAQPDGGAEWHLLQPAVAAQAAGIVFPEATTGADACALLATRPGVVNYLKGMGLTFSLGDIEQLARHGQVAPSVVGAAARGLQGEDRSWMYRVQLSERAVTQAAMLAVSYARAKTRHLAGLRSRPPRGGLRKEQLEFQETQIERMSHHLALLALCVEYGIGLWSCPMGADSDSLLDEEDDQPSAQWSIAVSPDEGR